MIKKNGKQCAGAIASWKDAEYLWQARSSVVPFVNLASETHYYQEVKEVCSILIGSGESLL